METVNGAQVQSFRYDLHDKLTGGIGESESYDANGNLRTVTLNGQTTTYAWDDEDRLTSIQFPDGHTDSYVYNGLGLRVAKTDSTGTYSYLCDGASPASPVLWDGQAVYTAGLSERRGGVSSYFDFDRLGNLWTVDGAAGAVQLYYQDTTGFGGVIAAAGNVGTPFRFGGGNGCQTDADIGLVLMGHRYYDTRIGRFISQDPAGDGDNWYSYAGNDPMDEVDPTGLFQQWMPSTDQTMSHDLLLGFIGGLEYGGSGFGGPGSVMVTKYTHNWFDDYRGFGPDAHWEHEAGSDTYSQEDITFNMGGSAMFAAGYGQSSVTTPEGAEAVAQLQEDGIAVGKPGNPAASIEKALQAAKDWLGKEVRAITNKDGDSIFMNKAGTKKLRFDIKNPSPHENPHAHIEELINGKWRGPRIYPRDVPPR